MMSSVSDLHMRKLRTYFHRRDVHMNGVLDLKDILKEKAMLARASNAPLDEKKIRDNYEQGLKVLGTMKTGFTFKEFVAMNTDIMKKYATDPTNVAILRIFTKDIFEAINTNQDGKVSADEYKIWYNTSCYVQDEDAWEKSFQLLDADNNGHVDVEEMTVGLARYLYADDESDYQHIMGPLITDERWNAAYPK